MTGAGVLPVALGVSHIPVRRGSGSLPLHMLLIRLSAQSS
jgi:hypothetical protein